MSLEDFYFLVTFMPRRIKRSEYVYWLDGDTECRIKRHGTTRREPRSGDERSN